MTLRNDKGETFAQYLRRLTHRRPRFFRSPTFWSAMSLVGAMVVATAGILATIGLTVTFGALGLLTLFPTVLLAWFLIVLMLFLDDIPRDPDRRRR